jgi:hypothetical protein
VHDDKHLARSTNKTLRASAARPSAALLDAEAGRPVVIDDGLLKLVELLRERSKTLVEMAQLARFYYVDAPARPKATAKFLRGDRGPASCATRSRRKSWDRGLKRVSG